MVIISNEDLKKVYHSLITIENIIKREEKRIKGNKFNLDKVVPEQLTRIYSQKETTALAFTDRMVRIVYENSVVCITSAFERIVFTKYRTAYGKVRSVVKEQSQPPMDYYKAREKFINGGIDKLSGIISLIEGHVSNDIFDKLKQIKDHRNYIAHGKRDVAPPAVEMTIDEIAQALDEAIIEIESY